MDAFIEPRPTPPPPPPPQRAPADAEEDEVIGDGDKDIDGTTTDDEWPLSALLNWFNCDSDGLKPDSCMPL